MDCKGVTVKVWPWRPTPGYDTSLAWLGVEVASDGVASTIEMVCGRDMETALRRLGRVIEWSLKTIEAIERGDTSREACEALRAEYADAKNPPEGRWSRERERAAS